MVIENQFVADPKAEMSNTTSPGQLVRILDFMETSWLGGPAKNLIEFARRAASSSESDLRVNIAVATFVRGSSPVLNEFTTACRSADLEVHTIREKSALDPSIISTVRRLINSYKPDIIQTHSVKSHFLVRLSGTHRKCPWIAFHHGYTWTDLKVRAYNKLDRWSLPAASKVVTVCRPFALALEEMGIAPDRIAIRHNAVKPFEPVSDVEAIELRRSLRVPSDARILLTIGRLSREKGQADLIKAIGRVRRENSASKLKLYLILVGPGPDRPKLEHVARTAGVSDCVIFAGHQPDVTPYYSIADLMVLPSHSEGSPNTLLEAMAARLPIVATAVGGIPEIVSANHAAVLVEKQNPIALARAISEVLRNESLRRQISSAAQAEASIYSPEAYCSSMLKLYRGCLSERTDTNTQRRSGRMHKTEVLPSSQ